MPRLYRPLDGVEGTWIEFYYPPGMDLAVVCTPRGWLWTIPPNVTVVDDKGNVVQAAPVVVEPIAEIVHTTPVLTCGTAPEKTKDVKP